MVRFLVITILGMIYSQTGFSKNSELYLAKKSFVVELKVFLKSIEREIPLNAQNKSWWNSFEIIHSAYAASKFNCFYGGWPSHLKKFGSKHLCTNPKTSEMYQHSYKCSEKELTCPAVLFGKDTCIPFVSQKDRLSAYSACDKKSQKENKTPEILDSEKSFDNQELGEYMQLVEDICEGRASNLKVSKNRCPSIQKKLETLRTTMGRSIASVVNSSVEKKLVGEDCDSCSEQKDLNLPASPVVFKLDEDVREASEKINLYEQFKSDFKNSELCKPSYNYPEESAQDHALVGVGAYINGFDAYYDQSFAPETWKKNYDDLMDVLKLDENQKNSLDKQFNKLLDPNFFGLSIANQTERFRQREVFRTHAQVLQANIKKVAWDKVKINPSLASDLAQEAYVAANVLVKDDDGKIDCPFIDADVFEKAMQGYEKLKGRLRKQYMTVIDYTKPSNQRRMFVLDMTNGKVMHNTWLTHGGGLGPEPASDELGRNAIMSNQNGSYLSSDGFIIAKQKSVGNLFGENIILQGVDVNNSNMQSRAIVLHGDSRAGGGYSPMRSSSEPEEVADRKERLRILETLDPNNAGTDPVSVRMMASYPRVSIRPTISTSNGCLGVPDELAYDRQTGTRISQLDTIRRDVSGDTLIFSYSGPEMRSRYFDN